jgi:hypothetical protein
MASNNRSIEFEPLVVDPQGAQKMLACGRTHLYEFPLASARTSMHSSRGARVSIHT